MGSTMEQGPTPQAHRRFAEKQWKLGTESTAAWRLSALSLERSANVLWATFVEDVQADLRDDEPESTWTVSGAFMLLAGLAVENYLKAICIKHAGRAFKENGKFEFFGHELGELAKTTGLLYDNAEIELLDRLTNFVEFAGRYPAPNKAEALIPKVKPDRSFRSVRSVSSSDHDDWQALVMKLSKALGPL